MNNSSRFFSNIDCEYYPCHQNITEINCLFCYCPLYHLEHCPGTFEFIDVNGKKIKNCTDCVFPHQPQNYDIIMQFLASKK